MNSLRTIFALLLLAVSVFAQNPTQPQPREVTTMAVTMLQPPIPPSGVTVGFTGAPGSSAKTVYYWLVSNFTVGNSSLSAVAPGFNAPTTFSVSNFFTVYWQPVAGANSYDLLRTSSPAPPIGACNCAVATAISGTSQVDQSNSLSSYTVNAFDPTKAILQLSAEAVGAGVSNVHYLLRQGGALVADLSAAAGGGLPSQSGQTPGSQLKTDGTNATWQIKPVCDTRDVNGADLGARIIQCDTQLGGFNHPTQQGNLAYNTTPTYGVIRVDPSDVGPITTFPVFISAGHLLSLGNGVYTNALGNAQPPFQLANLAALQCDSWGTIIQNSSNPANGDPRVVATASAYQVIGGVGQNNVPYATASGVVVSNCHFQDSGLGKLSTLTATVVYTNCINCKDLHNWYDGIGVTGVGLIGGFYSGPNCTTFPNWLAQYCGNFGSGDEISGDVFNGTQEAISVINNEHVDIHDVRMSQHATGASGYIDLESNTPKDHMQFIDIHNFIMDCSTPQINTGCFGVTMQSVGPNAGHIKIHDGIFYGPAPGTALSGQTTAGVSSGDFNPHGTHEMEIYNMKISQTSNPGISVAGVDYAFVHDNQEVCTGGGIAVFDFAQYSLFKDNRFVAPPRTDYTITSVATTADQATTVYTGTFPDGGSGALASQTVNITGFPTPANDGSFGVSTSDTTHLTVYNPAGVAETHAAIGSIGCSPSLGTDQNNTQINETAVTADFNTYENNTGSGQILLKGPHSQIPISQAADRITNSIGKTFQVPTGFANPIPGGIAATILTPPVLNTSGPTTNTCTVVFTNATYFWIVTAVAANGGEAPSNEVSQIAGGGGGCAKLGWTYVPGAASYNIYRGTSSGAEVLVFNVPQSTLGYTDGGGQTPGASVPTSNNSSRIAITTNVTWAFGAGVPAAGTCVAANGGSLYTRTDGDATHTLYVCDNSTHTWTPK